MLETPVTVVAMAAVYDFCSELVDHPPYSDLAQSDYFLFPNIKNKKQLAWKQYKCRDRFFFFSSRYTSPVQCWTHALAWSFRASKSSKVHGSGRRGQIRRCSIVCSSPQSQVASPSSYPHLCMRDLHLPVAVLRRLRHSQKGHASLEPDGRDSLDQGWVVWSILKVCRPESYPPIVGLAWRGSTKCRKLFLDLSLFTAGSCWKSGRSGSVSCLFFSFSDTTVLLMYGGAMPLSR